MAIRVTCRGCKTRFQVSDQFAGKEGPCPKCKAVIRIPAADEQVVIHGAPEAEKVGRARPSTQLVFRRETAVTPLGWTLAIATVVLLVALALLARLRFAGRGEFPLWALVVGALLAAVPTVYGAYVALRDHELEGYRGRELWIRVGCCAAVYALLWLSMPILAYALRQYDTLVWGGGMAVMFAPGGGVANLVFGFDYLLGLLHYGAYLGVTVLLRGLSGAGFLPGGEAPAAAVEGVAAAWRAARLLSAWWS